jgi:hypothetical protein
MTLPLLVALTVFLLLTVAAALLLTLKVYLPLLMLLPPVTISVTVSGAIGPIAHMGLERLT